MKVAPAAGSGQPFTVGNAVLATTAALTAVYLALLASDAVDALRGNRQWHIPPAPHPASPSWWLPLLPGVAISLLPLATLPGWATILLGAGLMSLLGPLLYQAQWGSAGDNLLAKILNGSNGFSSAAARISDLHATLAHYPAYLATFGASSHVPSHPPGDVLLFRALDGVMGSRQAWQQPVLAIGYRLVSGVPMLLAGGTPPSILAGAILSIPLLILLGRLACAPVAAIAARLDAPPAASALLFLSLPAGLLFIPLLDTVYPLLTAVVVLLGLAAIERLSWPLAGVTGLALGFSLLFTLGVAPIVLPLALYGLFRQRWAALRLAIPAAAGWAAAWLAMWLLGSINMPAIVAFIWAHQQAWEAQYSYWLWFRWKWYDFLMFGGLPLTVLTLCFLASSAGRWWHRTPRKIDLFFAGWLAMMVYLWLSPSALAETGRLWAPLYCFAALFGACALPRRRWALSLVLVLQIAQTIVLNRYLSIVSTG